MDNMEILDVEDGKDKDFNITVKNAFKLHCRDTEEVHLFCARKPEQKQRWLNAFENERKQVQLDQETGTEQPTGGLLKILQSADRTSPAYLPTFPTLDIH